jgi:lipopolysaccharide transport system ATP-binding protein
MSNVITAENLGKKYSLQHQQREQYTALRDVLAHGVRNLSKRIFSPFTPYRSPLTASEDFWALKDVSFEVKQGDRIGIIGRNGAGKSTLLKILSRITEPTTGSVRIKGRVASLLEVGTGFHPELTGRENIYLNGAILGMGRAEIKKKFDEIVDFAEIEKFLDTPVKRYSSGMYVRLAFAVAAHLEPEILIVDEVLAVGDAQFQKKCLGKMEDVGMEGRTVLFVSHNMAAVNQLCHMGLWLEEGIIKCVAHIGHVVEEYMTSGMLLEGSKIWENSTLAPGNDRIRLRAVRTRNRLGEDSAMLEMEHPFTVEIEYEILTPQAGMRTGFWVYTLEGVLVFVAGDNEDMTWQGTKRKEGIYISCCTIPGMLLNSGHFSISVAADIQGSEMLFLEHHVVSFQIEHTGCTTLDGASRSPGILCPSFNWRISQISGD